MRRRRATIALGAALAILLAAAALGVTFGAFRATTANSGNSFSAASSFAAQVATGSYTGNGSASRSISVAFQPEVVIVKATASQAAVSTNSAVTPGFAKALAGAVAPENDCITALTASGFTVSNDSKVNQSGTTYNWVAFRQLAGTIKVGSYTGNGSSRSITGVGFSPDYVSVLGSGATRAVERFKGAARTYAFDSETGSTTRVTSFDTDGFSVGSSGDVNTNGTTYYYFAVKATGGATGVASYSGNGTNNRNITGVGWQPKAVIVRADDTGTSRRGHMRLTSTGSSSSFFDAASDTTNGIKAFQTDGFQLGTDSSVNASGPTYYYLALR